MATAQYCLIVLREIQAVGPGFKKMLLIALAIRAVENLIWLAICSAPIKFTVTAAHEIIWDGANRTGVLTDLTGKATTGEITFTANTDKSELATKVVNKKGATLPSTGGIGTTIFYVVGGGLMAAAVVLFITKKRMENDQ